MQVATGTDNIFRNSEATTADGTNAGRYQVEQPMDETDS